MTKIIYIVPSLITAGPVSVLYNIVKNLNRESFIPVIVYLSQHELTSRNNKEMFEALGVEIIGHSYSKWQLQLHTASIALSIQQHFDGENVIFHAHGYYPTLILSRMKKAKTMSTIHNICDQDFKFRKGPWMGAYMAHRFKKALKNIHMGIPICHFMQEYYAGAGSFSLRTVCNGVEEEDITTPERKNSARGQLGIEPGVKVFLYPASFSLGKNHRFIISELKHSQHHDFVILFAGQGELEEECKKQAGDDRRFRFLGYQTNMDTCWAASDFLISSSRSEGMPMAVLEAVIRGLPCLLSKIPPHKEILRNIFGSEEMGFDLNEQGSLLKLMNTVIKKEFSREQIRQKSIPLYSSRAMCRGYEKIYNELSA